MFAQIHQNIDSLLTFQFEELERFQVFDILESAEEAKIKISNLSFSSFYSNMIEDILNSKDERFYNTFVLFENFLFFDENQVFSFCDLSTKEIKNLIFDFSKKNEEQLLSEYNEKIPILDPNISETKTENNFLEDKTIYSLIYSLLAFFIIVFGFFQIAVHNRRAAADLRTTNYSQPAVASISMSWLNRSMAAKATDLNTGVESTYFLTPTQKVEEVKSSSHLRPSLARNREVVQRSRSATIPSSKAIRLHKFQEKTIIQQPEITEEAKILEQTEMTEEAQVFEQTEMTKKFENRLGISAKKN